MIRVFSWIIAICVIVLFAGSFAMGTGNMDENVYLNVINIIWYIGIISTVGLLVSLIVDRIKTKKKEEKDGFRKY